MDRNVPTVLLLLAVLSHTRGQCPHPPGNKFVYSNATNKCYLAKSFQYSYENARSYCRNLVIDESFRIADLVSLDTKDSYLAVREIIDAQANPTFYHTWIGLRAQFTDWKWAPKTDHRYMEPQGCYDDIYGLGELIARDQPVETFEGCLGYCRNNFYKYAGRYLETTDEYRCRCSNTWNNNGMIVKDCDRQLNRMWVYRLQESTDANLWQGGEPDNWDGYARCLGLAPWPERGWDDSKCGERLDRSHICQFPLDTVECDRRGYYYYSNNDFAICLMPYRNSQLNWYGARSDCTEKGGDLLVDDREDLHAFIKTTFEISGETGTKTLWWLGGTSMEYTWENDEPLKNFQRWDRNEPRKGNPNALCARIHKEAGADASGDAGHKWEAKSCDDVNMFVCETSLFPTTPAPPTTIPTPATTPTTQAPSPTPVTATPATPAPTPATPAPTPATPAPPAPTPATPAPTPATPAPPAPTPATPAPTPATPATPATPETPATPATPAPPVPTPATPAPTPATPAPGPNTPPTAPPAPEESTAGPVTPTGDSAPSTGEDEDIIFTNGVIVAIVIAGVAVLVATIRLFVYCCQRRNGPMDDRKRLSP